MSTAPDDRDRGFSLVEVLVAITLLGLVAAAVVPLLVVSAQASASGRYQTRAKNLAQERLEQMRQLPFQVDRQNGNFIDLLDYYYTSLAPASGTGAGWVSSAGARLSGEPPTGAFYRTRYSGASLPGQQGFTQVVSVQFLRFDRTPVPDAALTGYDSQQVGRDTSPSNLLGVTVLTQWAQGGRTNTFRSFSQLGDSGSKPGLLASQASVRLLRAESALPDGSNIAADALTLVADGRLSDGSLASTRGETGRGTRTGQPDLVAAAGSSLDPSTCTAPYTSTCPDPQPNSVSYNPGSTACGTSSFGRSKVAGLTTTTLEGLSRAPADVGLGRTPANRTSGSLFKESGHACGPFWFDNKEGTPDPLLNLAVGAPTVAIAGDSTTTGSTPAASGDVYVNASPETASDRFVRAVARAANTAAVRLFPTSFAPEGVVKLRLLESQLTCDSSAAGPVGSYRLDMEYWNGTGYQKLLGSTGFSWSSASPTSSPLTAADLSRSVGFTDPGTGTALTLGHYIDLPTLATTLTVGSTNGVASIGQAVLSLTTKPVRAADPTSTVGLKLGELSCLSVDER